MPKVINIDKNTPDTLRDCGDFLFVVDGPGKKNATVYYPEDAAEIVELLAARGVVDEDVLSEDYWLNYNSRCIRRFNGEKVIKSYKTSKRKYFQKWNLKKMTTCPLNARCAAGTRCKRIRGLFPGSYTCKCRR